MATAQRGKVKVRRPAKNVPQYTLKLSEGEADFLIGMMAFVGGDPKDSPAKYARRIHDALSKATGYDWTQTDSERLSFGHIEFVNYDEEPPDNDLRVGVFLAVQRVKERAHQLTRGQLRGAHKAMGRHQRLGQPDPTQVIPFGITILPGETRNS